MKTVNPFYYFLFLFIVSPLCGMAQENKDAYYQAAYLRYEDYTYLPEIHTVQLHEDGNPLSAPVLPLTMSKKLKLSFDDFSSDLKNLQYTIVHCNAQWQPSDIPPSFYLDGYTEEVLNTYVYSSGTLQSFIHYSLVFPTNTINITKSGNYLIKVFQDGDPEKLVLTRRFMVYSEQLQISGLQKQASDIEDHFYKQEIDFVIRTNNASIANPFDLKTVILQNNRWDNAITGLKPIFVRDGELTYDYDRDNVFNGGSEFRYFDIKNLHYKTERIAKVYKDSLQKQHVELYPDEKRSFKKYSSALDINGRFYINSADAINNDRDADYAYVHFSLPMQEPFADANVYIFGQLSDLGFRKEYRMEYNYEKSCYEATLYLKQGFYNYEYVVWKDGQPTADETQIEGNHFETENEYTILAYFKAPGTNYDQLIGYTRLTRR